MVAMHMSHISFCSRGQQPPLWLPAQQTEVKQELGGTEEAARDPKEIVFFHSVILLSKKEIDFVLNLL